jgi:hypothetical protein
MPSQSTLSNLSIDLLLSIFKLLDQHSTPSLAFSLPKSLHLFARYYHLDHHQFKLYTLKGWVYMRNYLEGSKTQATTEEAGGG